MIQTSPTYNPFPTVRSPGAGVSFEVLAKTLNKDDIVASVNVSAKAGSVNETLNGVSELPKKYATLEQEGWILDGTHTVLADSGEEAGYWSTVLSGDDGILSENVVIHMTMPSPTNTFGWTFHFDAPTQIWATEIEIQCYDSGGWDLDSITVHPTDAGSDGKGWSVNHFVREYKSVDFIFRSINQPLRMLRVSEIDFGVSRHFDQDSMGEMKIVYGMSPDASEFPAKEFKFTFDNSDGEFNVLDPIGAYAYWRNGQILTARIKISDEIVDMGRFYVTRAEIGRNRLTAKVTAHDECYKLASQKYYPFTMVEQTSVTLAAAVAHVIRGYDMPVDLGGLGDELVSLQIRETHNKRTVLRYLAQAARSTVWIARNGTLTFRRLQVAELAAGQITADELYDWSGVSIAEEITGVTLTVERELEKDEQGDPVTETYTSGEPDDEGAHTAVYENPCVLATNGQAVADWLLSMSNWRKQYAVKNRCDPAVELGDTLMIEDAFHNDNNAVVTGVEVSYDGTLSAVTSAARNF